MDMPSDSDDDIPEPYELHLLQGVQEHYALSRHFQTSGSSRLRKFPRLPVAPQPLEDGDLRYMIEHEISDGGVRHMLDQMGKAQSSEDEMKPESEAKPSTESALAAAEPSTEQSDHSGGLMSMLRSYLAPTASGSQLAPPVPDATQTSKWNVMDLLFSREAGLNRTNNWSAAQKRGALCPSWIPRYPVKMIDRRSGNAYTADFTDDGELFVAGYQDKVIKVYEVQPGSTWPTKKTIAANVLQWTITDTCLSPDGRFLLYSTILPVVYIVKIRGENSVVESEANITEIHNQLIIGEEGNNVFGIWSMAWSKNGRELVVGTNGDQDNVSLYDMEHGVTTQAVLGHGSDVNAVAYMDDASQVFVSGSDDNFIKIWDRRTFGESSRSVGTLVGHLEGITHIDTKGDGHYLISNCKDQMIKLWDIRKSVSDDAASSYRQLKNSTLPHFLWDYRWNEYPGKGYVLEHPRDASLMTFRGHSVLQTLIRAYFSPQFTTGQRYIYAGCRSGTIRIFDILTGEAIHELTLHRSVVRDCAWHPYEMLLASTSWDGSIVQWLPRQD